MRTCPFTDCTQDIPDVLFACKKHWFQLTLLERKRIHEAYEQYCDNKMDLDQLRLLQSHVVDQVEAREVDRRAR